MQLDHVAWGCVNPAQIISRFTEGLIATESKVCGLNGAPLLFDLQGFKQAHELFTGIVRCIGIVGYDAGDYAREILTKVIELSME
jgi:hypothetical protein